MVKEVFRFEFVVEGITKDQAERMLEITVLYVEFLGGRLFGGFVVSEDEEPTPVQGGES